MSQKFRFQNLDSIRTIACLCVFWGHSFSSTLESLNNNPIYIFVNQFRRLFSFGVPVFFVLSGFLISYLMLKEQTSPSSFSIRNFYIRRVLRIWPVYFIVVIFGFLVFPMLRTYFLKLPYFENANILYYIFFISNFDQIANNQLPFGVGLGPTWSVGVEEQFYLIWPILLILFKKKKFIYPIILLMAISLVGSFFFNLNSKHTLYCFIYLAMGSLFAYMSFYYRPFINKIVTVNKIWFVVSILLINLLIQFGLNGIFAILSNMLIAIFIGYVIIFQCFSGKMELRKIPIIERLGKYTYGLYLYHSIGIFLIKVLVFDVLKFDENIITVIFVGPICSLGLSIFMSYLSYKYIEKWALDLKNTFNAS